MSFVPREINDEDQEEYKFLLIERAAYYSEQGLSDDVADKLALDDFGCIEFWQYLEQVNRWCDDRRTDTKKVCILKAA
jgi:hypothetical protein